MLIDTLKAKKRLTEEYGMDERHAEGIVEVLSSAEERLATSQDVDAVRQELDPRLQALEARLTRKMYGIAFVIITVLGALNVFT